MNEPKKLPQPIKLLFNEGELPDLESLCAFDEKSAAQFDIKSLGRENVEAILNTANHLRSVKGQSIKGVEFKLDDGDASMRLII